MKIIQDLITKALIAFHSLNHININNNNLITNMNQKDPLEAKEMN